MDLADIPEETRKEWVENNRIEFYVGDEVNDRYIAGNIIKLSDISARVLAGWEKRGWIVPYSGSLASP